jgi:chorismate mutase
VVWLSRGRGLLDTRSRPHRLQFDPTLEESAVPVRGIRGATTAAANTRDAILDATRELLRALIEANGIDPAEVASAWFTTSPDLNAEFPAVAAREDLGWSSVPLMCGHDMNVPGSLPQCLRILLHVNTDRSSHEIKHVYLRGAVALRRDLADAASSPNSHERS